MLQTSLENCENSNFQRSDFLERIEPLKRSLVNNFFMTNLNFDFFQMTQKDSLILIGAKDGRVKAYMVSLKSKLLRSEYQIPERSEYQMPKIRTF